MIPKKKVSIKKKIKRKIMNTMTKLTSSKSTKVIMIEDAAIISPRSLKSPLESKLKNA